MSATLVHHEGTNDPKGARRQVLWALVGGLLVGAGTPASAVPVLPIVAMILLFLGGTPSWGASLVFGAALHASALRFVPSAFDDVHGGGGWPVWAAASVAGGVMFGVGVGLGGALIRRGVSPIVGMAIGFCVGEALVGVLAPIPVGVTASLAACPALLGPAAIGGRPLLALFVGAFAASRRVGTALCVLCAWIVTAPLLDVGDGPVVDVAAVQTDRPGGEPPSRDPDRADQLLRLVAEADGSDVVVTPEDAWPWRAGVTDRGRADFSARFADLPPLLLGVVDDGRNSVLVVEQGVVGDRYDKRRLVPFVEPNDGLRAGSGPAAVDVAGLRIGVLICWEDVFPTSVASLPHDVDLLALPTSDVWLGIGPGSGAHLDAARLAAVTSGRWAVRAARSGTSALIDPAGRLRALLPAQDPDPDATGAVLVGVAAVRRPIWSGAQAAPWVGGASLLVALLLGRSMTTSGPRRRPR